MSDRPRCYFCNRFISYAVWVRNWKLIQAPGVSDPEPYEISWCDQCEKDGSAD